MYLTKGTMNFLLIGVGYVAHVTLQSSSQANK